MAGTVLIVDDEPQLLRLLIRVFEKEGFRVLSAEDGDTALELFGEHAGDIDVLILDVIIPPDGAASVLSAVLSRRPDVLIVLASGDALEDDLEALLAEHGGVFMRKPFLPRALIRTVRELQAAPVEAAT